MLELRFLKFSFTFLDVLKLCFSPLLLCIKLLRFTSTLFKKLHLFHGGSFFDPSTFFRRLLGFALCLLLLLGYDFPTGSVA